MEKRPASSSTRVPDVAMVHQAIADYWRNGKRRPWGETFIYQGRRRVYSYELPS